MNSDPTHRTVPASELLRRFARLTGLNILGNIVVPLASLIDTAMLGHLPEVHHLSGVALAGVLFNYVYWTFGFLRMATTGETAQAVGRRDRSEEFTILYRALIVGGAIAGLILAAQWLIAEGGFRILAGEADVKAAGRDYFFARVWGAPAALLNFAFLGWFLGREQSQNALAMALTANVTNVAGNYLMIMQWGWGSTGAGIATALSNWAMLAMAAVLFYAQNIHKSSEGAAIPAPVARVIFQRDRLVRLYSLNRDIMIRTFVLISAFSIFTNFSSEMGMVVLAANAILLRFVELAAYLIDGSAFAVESLAGILRGAGDRAGFLRLRRIAMFSGVGFAFIFCLPVFLIPDVIFRLMTDRPELLYEIFMYRYWLAPILFAGAAAFIYDGIYLGLTEARALRNSMLLSFCIGFAPAAIYGVFRAEPHWLWLAMALFMCVRAISLHTGMRDILRTEFTTRAT